MSFHNRSKVWRNLIIPSQEENVYLFLSSLDLKSHFEEKLDLFQQIFVMLILEFAKSLNLASIKKNVN